MKTSESLQKSRKKVINYITQIDTVLKPKIDTSLPITIDLFAGCGGLSLGFEAHGFLTQGWEKNKDACTSYNHNLMGNCLEINLCLETNFGSCKILIGGPPCQPFSVSGKQKGLEGSVGVEGKKV